MHDSRRRPAAGSGLLARQVGQQLADKSATGEVIAGNDVCTYYGADGSLSRAIPGLQPEHGT